MRLNKSDKEKIINNIITDKFKVHENDIKVMNISIAEYIYDRVYNSYHKQIIKSLPKSFLTTVSSLGIDYRYANEKYHRFKRLYFASDKKIFENLKYGLNAEELELEYDIPDLSTKLNHLTSKTEKIREQKSKLIRELQEIFSCINTVKQLKQWGKADKYCNFKEIEKHLPQKSAESALYKLNSLV